MEWLFAATIILALWASIVAHKIDNDFTKQYMHLIVPAPIIFVLTFGVYFQLQMTVEHCNILIYFQLYAATVVLYRVFTFNNCEEAATELKKVF